jgi:hypothetical protein
VDISVSTKFLNSGDISDSDELDSGAFTTSRDFMGSEIAHNSEVWRDRSGFSFPDSLGFRASAEFNVTKQRDQAAAREMTEAMSRIGFILSIVVLLVVGVAFWIHSMVLEERIHPLSGSRRLASSDDVSVRERTETD